MPRSKEKLVFGKRPMLFVQEWGHGTVYTRLRIIYPDDRVEFCDSDHSGFLEGCTSAKSQKAAYQNCFEYFDNDMGHSSLDFLGYL